MSSHLAAEFPDSNIPRVSFECLTAPESAPASITSITTSILSATHSLDVVLPRINDTTKPAVHAVLVACFSAHPLVPMLRELTTLPIVGIMEAGILYGSQVGGNVGVVTTDKRWEPLLEHEIEGKLGLKRQCAAGVLSSGLSVLELETLPKEQVYAALCKAAKKMVDEREADAILLGCAGMVGLTEVIQKAVGQEVTVLDPVVCAAEMCISLARMKLRTAKKGRYETSEPPKQNL